MTRRFIPKEVKDRALELREQGLGYARIARELGISVGSVSWHCLLNGAYPPRAGQRKVSPARTQVIRNGKPVRPFTPEEDMRLTEMSVSGAKIADICRALGRQHNSIVGRMATLARREELGQ